METLVFPIFGFILPFLSWTIELFLPYPHLVEEALKSILVFISLRIPGRWKKIKLITLTGIFFAFSESVFYLFNIYSVGNLRTLFYRLVFTIPLHTITSLTILLPAMKDKRMIFLGAILAATIHYFYNLFIPAILPLLQG